jgi:hypothetical protein
MTVLFAITLFLSSALLFFVQPMFAKMVLPLLGGTPGVWNTCMAFFQAVLLDGYAAYARPGQELTYFEIDPAVVRIARDEGYFHFLGEAPIPAKVVLGDARLTLEQAADNSFDILVIDAFSSDAIPLHLLTRAALSLYKSKLSDRGVILFHISNRYLNLGLVLGDLAHDAGLRCRAWHDTLIEEADKASGKTASEWVIMARAGAPLDGLIVPLQWRDLPHHHGRYLWTDDFSNLFSVFRWREE